MGGTRVKLTGDDLTRRAAGSAGLARPRRSPLEDLSFPDFKSALDFVNRVGAVAEEQGHHPDIHLTWGRADIETWTHDAGGITESDFTLAAKIDEQFSQALK